MRRKRQWDRTNSWKDAAAGSEGINVAGGMWIAAGSFPNGVGVKIGD